MSGLLVSDRPGKMPTLRCKFAAKGAEEGLRGTVAFGTLEKKRQASAANIIRGSLAGEPPRNDILSIA